MSIWGKIIGGAAGLIIGGPLGALIGLTAGHAVDSVRSRPKHQGDGDPAISDDATRSIAFTIGVIVLGAKMAKADGTVTRDEVSAFKEVFKIPPEEMKNVARVFNAARLDAEGFEPYAKQLANLFKDRRVVLEDLLSCLFHIARADGHVHDAELAFVTKVATIFGFSQAEFSRIKEAELGPDKGDPYHILGVQRDDDEPTVKSAYRALIREHHPDRAVAAGLPAEMVEIATQRMATINAAYDKICTQRGWS